MSISDGTQNVTFHLHTNYTYSSIQTSRYPLFAAFTINILVGLPTNCYVLWLIVTGAGSGVASEFFALNLSVSEIIYCLGTVLMILKLYSFSVALSTSASFFAGVVLGRFLFQSYICLERYLAVVHPVTFLKYKPLKYRAACSAVSWLLIIGFCLFSMFKQLSRSVIYFSLALCLVCFSVKLFCCLAVLRALKQPGPGEGGREREGENHVKKRAFRIILVILVSMVINYIPVTVTLCIRSLLSWEQLYLGITIYTSFYIMTGFVQPLLYLHRAGKLPLIRGP